MEWRIARIESTVRAVTVHQCNPGGGIYSLISNTGVDFESLIDVLAERIAAKVEAKRGSGTTAPGKRLLTTEEAAEYLGRTKEAMQHLVAGGKLPTIRSDRRVFFDVHDLDTWIRQNKQTGFN